MSNSILSKINNYGIECCAPYELISYLTELDLVSYKDKSIKEILDSDLNNNKLQSIKRLIMLEEKENLIGFKINKGWELINFFNKELSYEDKEILKVINLNSINEVISHKTIHIGGLSKVEVYPRDIFKFAILSSASKIIIMHNHPSGNPEPSENDIELTENLIKCGDILGIKVIDHIIVAKNTFYSFKREGEMY